MNFMICCNVYVALNFDLFVSKMKFKYYINNIYCILFFAHVHY